jgi:hypothetical protein
MNAVDALVDCFHTVEEFARSIHGTFADTCEQRRFLGRHARRRLDRDWLQKATSHALVHVFLAGLLDRVTTRSRRLAIRRAHLIRDELSGALHRDGFAITAAQRCINTITIFTTLLAALEIIRVCVRAGAIGLALGQVRS